MENLSANNVDPDQTPYCVASYQGSALSAYDPFTGFCVRMVNDSYSDSY